LVVRAIHDQPNPRAGSRLQRQADAYTAGSAVGRPVPNGGGKAKRRQVAALQKTAGGGRRATIWARCEVGDGARGCSQSELNRVRRSEPGVDGEWGRWRKPGR
jgi:hypothetical protein